MAAMAGSCPRDDVISVKHVSHAESFRQCVVVALHDPHDALAIYQAGFLGVRKILDSVAASIRSLLNSRGNASLAAHDANRSW